MIPAPFRQDQSRRQAARASPTQDEPDGLTWRLTWRLNDVCQALGVSRRTIERERAAGRFPRPDLILNRMPLWKPETIRAYVERGGR